MCSFIKRVLKDTSSKGVGWEQVGKGRAVSLIALKAPDPVIVQDWGLGQKRWGRSSSCRLSGKEQKAKAQDKSKN